MAEDLEQSGDLKAAEEQYILGGEWALAVNMYKENRQWSEAYRVAKSRGGEVPAKQIAFLWGKDLGGDAAVKLLQNYGLLEEAIDHGMDKK